MASKHKKQADGRYRIRVQTGRNDEGKPQYKNIYARTQDELAKKERDLR